MNLREMLEENKIYISDGAWGTELAKKGIGPGKCPELLNVENRKVLDEIALSYVEAGANFILTNTFGGNPYKLRKYGVEDRLEELNEAGVRISKDAAEGRALVLGSIGPSGEFLAPLGLVTKKEMIAGFVRQVQAFIAGGADAVIIESMTDLNEILCALKAVKDNSDYGVICSMTFDKGLQGYATMMGVKPADAVHALEKAGAEIVGSNCGWGIEEIIEVARIMRAETQLPLWFKPNAGMPELIDGETVYRHTPEYMASKIPELIDAGAKVVGGCCGSTPDHIRKIREIVNAINILNQPD
ncbi:MAG: homocysteine S-methyltransferase family protein [Candidatus Latescibacteria bacterium]|nr:homocysteine S-methyltransferase family protein [Candidatus Latescibacterota bacterium]